MEPSVELYQFLYERAQSNPNHRLALHLSNIQGANLHGLEHTLPVQEARLIYEKVLRSAASCEEFFQTLGGASITIWAPTDTATTLQLVSAFKKFALLPGAGGTVHLAVPHNPYPGCATPEQILDLWGHELLSPKWRTIVQNIEFFRQPTRCVFSGSMCPLHHIKTITMFTLSTVRESTMMLSTQWRPTLLEDNGGLSIIVDCPEVEELKRIGCDKIGRPCILGRP